MAIYLDIIRTWKVKLLFSLGILVWPKAIGPQPYTPRRATTSQTNEQAKADLQREIAAKQAELASLQEQAIAADEGAAEPSETKVLHKQFD